jgi:GNAT superfamily N-acetyltransferase
VSVDTNRTEPGSRVGQVLDVPAVTRTITLAFEDDPVWGPVFGTGRVGFADREAIWDVMIRAALRHPWSRVVGDAAAVSIWVAPGGTELNEDEEHELVGVMTSRLGAVAADEAMALIERFEDNHPAGTEHAYLSLLATHPDRRGEGLGMALLREDLQRLDDQHLPAYLESTNPANDHRYRSVGFEPVDAFQTLDGARTISTMWRSAR